MEQMSGQRAVTVRQRTRQTIPAGIGLVVMVLGLATSLAAQPTVSGKITAAVFFAVFIALIVWFWLRVNRWRDRIEITPDAITFRRGRRGGPSIALTRADGTDLRLIPALREHGVTSAPRLALVGSGQDITIHGFSTNAVRRGCTAAGWQLGSGTLQEARDLRDLS
jgi:membrane protein YdbS with pleckstrin-like domain